MNVHDFNTAPAKPPEEMTWLIKCHPSDVSGFSASERQEESEGTVHSPLFSSAPN